MLTSSMPRRVSLPSSLMRFVPTVSPAPLLLFRACMAVLVAFMVLVLPPPPPPPRRSGCVCVRSRASTPGRRDGTVGIPVNNHIDAADPGAYFAVLVQYMSTIIFGFFISFHKDTLMRKNYVIFEIVQLSKNQRITQLRGENRQLEPSERVQGVRG